MPRGVEAFRATREPLVAAVQRHFTTLLDADQRDRLSDVIDILTRHEN